MTIMIIFVLVAIILFCKHNLSTSRKRLSDAQKGLYHEFLITLRIPAFFILVVGTLLLTFIPYSFLISTVFYFLFIIGKQTLIYNHIKKLNFPNEFLNDTIIFNAIICAALLALTIEFVVIYQEVFSDLQSLVSSVIQ